MIIFRDPIFIFLYLLTAFLCLLATFNYMNRYWKHILWIQNKNFFILTDDFVFFFGSSDIEWHWIGVFVFIYALIKSGRTNPFSEKSITSLSTWFNFLSTNKGTVYAQNNNYSGVINVHVNIVAEKLDQMDVGDEMCWRHVCHQHHELGPSIKNLVTNI